MRILIDILHPAHVHFFRHFRDEVMGAGHEVLVTAREKDVTTELLRSFDIDYTLISTQRSGAIGLISEMICRTSRLYRIARQWEADILIGIMGPSIAVVGRLLRTPTTVFYDTEMATATNTWVYPLATAVVTPESYHDEKRKNQVTYAGYHELAYLHPDRFQPDEAILRKFGLNTGEEFSLVRFVSWKASHDFREISLTVHQKRQIVNLLAQYGKVLILSEGHLPADLDDRLVTGPVEHIHHLLAHASILVGESATMSSEASVLGVPSIFISKTGRGYIDDQEARYGLTRHFSPSDFDAAILAIVELLGMPAERRASQRAKLLRDNIEVTAWMTEFVLGLGQ